MGREDPLFFAAALAAGTVLAELARGAGVTERIEPLGGETCFEGSQFSVRVERFRYADGEIVERELVRRQGAAAVVAYDDEHVWLVRQPREALVHTLELPAGKLDVEGESPLQTAQRELGEEIGREADDVGGGRRVPSVDRLHGRARLGLRGDGAARLRRRADRRRADRDRGVAARRTSTARSPRRRTPRRCSACSWLRRREAEGQR